MDFFLPFLPQLFAIYLVLIGWVADRFVLRTLINNYVKGKATLQRHSHFITDVARDWAARIAFINSMFLGIVTLLVAFEKCQNYPLAVFAVVGSLIINIPVLLWIFGHGPAELVSLKTKDRTIGRFTVYLYHSWIVNTVIIATNLFIMVALFYGRQPTANP